MNEAIEQPASGRDAYWLGVHVADCWSIRHDGEWSVFRMGNDRTGARERGAERACQLFCPPLHVLDTECHGSEFGDPGIRAAAERGAHPSGHWTLAWFDGAEGIWRNQAKADAPDFEHFRRREALQAAPSATICGLTFTEVL